MQVCEQSLVFRSCCRDCGASCLAVYSAALLLREVSKGRLVDGCAAHRDSSVADFVVDAAGVTQLRETDLVSVCGSLVRLETKTRCSRWTAFFKRRNGFLIAGLSLAGPVYCLFDRNLRCLDQLGLERSGSRESADNHTNMIVRLEEAGLVEFFLCLRFRTAFEVLACRHRRLSLVHGPTDLLDFRGSQSSLD